jgi:hypothetical protein
MVLGGGVGSGEFCCKVGEVGECEFAGVGTITDTEETDVIFDGVA